MAKISGTELRRAALELKTAQAVERLRAAPADVDGALAILSRSAAEDEAAFYRAHAMPQVKPVLVFNASQRLLRALEGVAATLDGDEEFGIEICDGRKVVRVEMCAGKFEVREGAAC